MYLKNIFVENNGPIKEFKITEKDLFTKEGQPKIVLLVGPNGTGKTVFISNIVDALYLLAGHCFEDIKDYKINWPYYRLLGISNQRYGSIYGLTYIQFQNQGRKYEYFEKTGHLSYVEAREKTNNLINLWWKSQDDQNNIKEVTKNIKNDKYFQKDFQENVYAFFPYNRFEIPHWMNAKMEREEHIFLEKKTFKNELNKKIWIKHALNEINKWILDLFLECCVRLKPYSIKNVTHNENDIESKKTLTKSLIEIEKILSKILGIDVEFQVDFQKKEDSYLKIVRSNTNHVILNDLNQFSAGQATLFIIFTTIIKYASMFGKERFKRKINLNEITGIVIIDEIEMNLHIKLQKEVLPELISMFPNVQFIISSHSPFFLYGMDEKFKEKLLTIKMPDGDHLQNIDNFSEFDDAYKIFKDLSTKNKEERNQMLEERKKRETPLVICEGPTDVDYLKKTIEIFGIKVSFELDWIGAVDPETERSVYGGLNNLKTLIFFLNKNKMKVYNKNLFLFDCDANLEEKWLTKQNNKLFIYEISQNQKNKLIEKGIENLFPENLIQEIENKNKKIFKEKDGKISIEHKVSFQKLIFENPKKEYFENFKILIEKIEKILGLT